MKRVERDRGSRSELSVKGAETRKQETNSSRPTDLFDEGISISPSPEMPNLDPNQRELDRLYRDRQNLLKACKSPEHFDEFKAQVEQAFLAQDHDSQSWSLTTPLWALAKRSNLRGYADRQEYAKNTRDELIALIQAKKDALLAPDRLSDAAGQAEIDLPELSRIIGDLKQIRFSDLDPEGLLRLGKSRDLLSKRLFLLIRESAEKDKPFLEELKSKLDNLVIPPGAGSKVRFGQAQYQMNLTNSLGPHLSRRSPAKDFNDWLEKPLGERTAEMRKKAQRALEQEKDFVERFKSTSAALLEEVKKKSKEYPHRIAVDLADKDIFGKVRTVSNMVDIDTLHRNGLDFAAAAEKKYDALDPDMSAVKGAFLEISKQKQVAQLGIPGHAMMIATDPEAGVYRFFDPNVGIYKFDDPKIFSDVVSRYINDSYVGTAGFDRLKLSSYLEVPVDQMADPQQGFDEGVCNALSMHVAKWLLEHPDFKGKLTAEMLGLIEFNAVAIYEQEAKRHLEREEYGDVVRAAIEGLWGVKSIKEQELGMSVLSYLRHDEYEDAQGVIAKYLEEEPTSSIGNLLQHAIRAAIELTNEHVVSSNAGEASTVASAESPVEELPSANSEPPTEPFPSADTEMKEAEEKRKKFFVKIEPLKLRDK